MPKLLAWVLRATLMMMTPVFLFCAGVARSMMWLDAWAADQLAAEPAIAVSKPQLVPRDTSEEWVSAQRGGR